MNHTVFYELVEQVGNKRRLAKSIGVDPALVNHWETGYREVSGNHAIRIEVLHGVKAKDLAPDLYNPQAW